jgi:hypothetical protein
LLGIVMVKAFGVRLNHNLAHLALPLGVVQYLHANEIQLAGLRAPGGLDPAITTAVSNSIGNAFIFGFRIIMFICAFLAFASAAITWLIQPTMNQRETV